MARRESLAEWSGVNFEGEGGQKAKKMVHSNNEVFVNPLHPHAELIAAFRRAQADAAHKFGLIKIVSKKGPLAIQTAIDTSAKAAKRRHSYAKKLQALGVILED